MIWRKQVVLQKRKDFSLYWHRRYWIPTVRSLGVLIGTILAFSLRYKVEINIIFSLQRFHPLISWKVPFLHSKNKKFTKGNARNEIKYDKRAKSDIPINWIENSIYQNHISTHSTHGKYFIHNECLWIISENHLTTERQ